MRARLGLLSPTVFRAVWKIQLFDWDCEPPAFHENRSILIIHRNPLRFNRFPYGKTPHTKAIQHFSLSKMIAILQSHINLPFLFNSHTTQQKLFQGLDLWVQTWV
jgi:hypothetical protein